MNPIFGGDFGAALAPVAVLAVVNTALVVAAAIAEHLKSRGSTVEAGTTPGNPSGSPA